MKRDLPQEGIERRERREGEKKRLPWSRSAIVRARVKKIELVDRQHSRVLTST